MKRWWVAIGLVGTLAFSACAKQSDHVPDLGRVVSCTTLDTMETARGVAFPCMDGKSTLDFATLHGPLIVNVWGSWCAPCRDEIPIIRNFYSRAQSKLQLLGIDVEEANSTDGPKFVVTHGMTWPILVDPDGRSRAIFGMGVPVTWFISTEGKVVFKKIGVLKSEQELRDLTQKYLHLTVS